MAKTPIVLIIMDGIGINKNKKGNAVLAAKTPNLDEYFDKYPHTALHASGINVGLPEGQIGNSEVGHMNIGAGRVVNQISLRITKSIKDEDFYTIKEFIETVENCKKNNSKLHLLGLVSDGGVHSYNTHLYALLELAKKENFNDVYIHCFLDGRDVPPNSGIKYIKELEEKTEEIGVGKIASVMGRYYAMDRDTEWERVKMAYEAMVLGKGKKEKHPQQAILSFYEKDEYDEFIKPTVIFEKEKPVATIDKDDSVIFFNFRGDRAREITRAFVEKDFNEFSREKGYFPLHYVCMTEYDKTINNVSVVFKPQEIKNVFGKYISELGLNQLRIAETTKYAHVTFFFNGGREVKYEGEDRVLIPSPEVDTFDQQPEMSAREITEEVITRIHTKKYDYIVMNYANGDMVGHSANFEATKTAVETVDQCLGKVVEAVLDEDGVAVVTADHGNAEQLIDYETGGKLTAHTINLVPFIVIGKEDIKLKQEGRLADIAPTMLSLNNIEGPKEINGSILIK